MNDMSAEAAASWSAALQVRLLAQMALATGFATLHSVRDLRVRRSPRFWSSTSARTLNRPIAQDLWANLGRLALLGLALDAFCQATIQGVGSAVQAVAIAVGVAIPLYLVLRTLIVWAVSKLRALD